MAEEERRKASLLETDFDHAKLDGIVKPCELEGNSCLQALCEQHDVPHKHKEDVYLDLSWILHTSLITQ